ncbi:nucleotidyltransferase family protein [Evansella sp. AB-P1]|uniref:nucleotidyltransferase family protein n=1 Tax=Evansella sp. AB-P1 TaxID=3037653 RepID=UPI00241C0F6C|nr:nucleotidyltransferase family protein [Evansella sp. AB-P1]MDG5788607.1 nucleotidyltransferase family protein [Evansella sp. AB-P1]
MENKAGHELDILKWAAGGMQDISKIHKINEQKLLDLIFHHRLAGRLLEKLQQIYVQWTSENLLIQLNIQCQEASKNLKNRISLMNEINESIPTRKKPIILKGFTDYFLTRESSFIRRSKDIDIVYDDLELLKETLIKIGFKRIENSASHEEGNYYRGDMWIDVHKVFPIRKYPKELENITPYNPGDKGYIDSFQQGIMNFEEKHLIYNELNNYVTEQDGFNILNIHAAVLISCLHLFRNFTKFSGKELCINLSEIASVQELVDQPQFIPSQFEGIVKKYRCEDSVKFVCHLLNEYLLYVPDKLESFMDTKKNIMINKSMIGIWGFFEKEDDLITFHNKELEMHRLFKKIEINKLKINKKCNDFTSYNYSKNLKAIIQVSDNYTPIQQETFNVYGEYDDEYLYIGLKIKKDKYKFNTLEFRSYFRHPNNTSIVTNVNTLWNTKSEYCEILHRHDIKDILTINSIDNIAIVVEINSENQNSKKMNKIVPLMLHYIN